MSRYIAGIAGKNHDQSPNYAVTDTMPPIGRDGRCADFKTLEEARDFAKEINENFARLCETMKKGENRSWQPLGNGFYAFLLDVPENKFYID